ncbi:unnamed protein product [Echinostoma caproni]|uniref:Oxidored_molyb domain-containing protein n=1 Tax=Echinostoma caproni TaxID=27848 RepID=A0A183B7D6_9TREM|nr:unnamed protein product [Echinostoma caproni]
MVNFFSFKTLEVELTTHGFIPDYRVLTSYSRLAWLGLIEGLGSTPAMDSLAPAMDVGRGCIHHCDYMRPHSGPG